jgi:hypothetical protein
MIINFRNWNHNKNNMLTSSNGNQILFKFSSIKLNLKLKFECKVRLVIELGIIVLTKDHKVISIFKNHH